MFRRVIPVETSYLVRSWLGTLETLQSVRSYAGALYVHQIEQSARRRFAELESEMTEQDRWGLSLNLRHRARGDA